MGAIEADLSFLGLALQGGGRSTFELTPPLARIDGRLDGGAAVAVAVAAAAEAETGKDARWITAQFIGAAIIGERIACDTDVLAAGRRVCQVRVTGQVGDRVVFCARDDAKPDGFHGAAGGFASPPGRSRCAASDQSPRLLKPGRGS